MAPSPLQQRRAHNTLLFQKLLNLRDGASPFTLILDTLEQRGQPVVKEFVRRAKIAKAKIILISFVTLRKKLDIEVDVFLSTRGKPLSSLRTEIRSHVSSVNSSSSTNSKTLIMIDSLNTLASTSASDLPSFLSSLILGPHISLLASYHTDVPLSTSSNPISNYAPHPLTTLSYLATAILQLRNLRQTIIRKHARDRSLQEPVWGLDEGREGVLVGLTSGGKEIDDGVVIEMEIRRKSGRGIIETFVLSSPSSSSTSSSSKLPPKSARIPTAGLVGKIILLDDHPMYNSHADMAGSREMNEGAEVEVETTFNLGLTEKQRRDRDGVVLPYFDAQKDGGALGAGDGGRILYDMGAEDREDFDDEEDEI